MQGNNFSFCGFIYCFLESKLILVKRKHCGHLKTIIKAFLKVCYDIFWLKKN